MIRLQTWLCSITVLALTASAATAETPVWQYDNFEGGRAYVESDGGQTVLALICSFYSTPVLAVYFLDGLQGWTPDAAVSIVIDDRVFLIPRSDGGSDYVLLSDVADPEIGSSETLIAAMQDGSRVTLEGPAASGLPLDARSYDLVGADLAIAAVKQGCVSYPQKIGQ